MKFEKSLALLLTAALVGPIPAQAFDGDTHREILNVLGGNLEKNFLRTDIRRNINNQHEWMDNWRNGGDDEKHFDDCAFGRSAEFLRDRYKLVREALAGNDVWGAVEQFGNALHTVQDFYSHSNWVEMGFPANEYDARQSDLVELSGAQQSLATEWFAPPGGGIVRDDIVLGAGDWEWEGRDNWRIDPHGSGMFVPSIISDVGRKVGRLLVTGKGSGDHDCKLYNKSSKTPIPLPLPGSLVFSGFSHLDLNKDGTEPDERPIWAGEPLISKEEHYKKHMKARKLAELQTAYEWCRLVHEAARVDRDGLVLAMFVKEGGTPHPVHTPCAPAGPGPTSVVVTVTDVVILDARDDGDDPGEIQLAAVLYDDPNNFHRSVHVSNRSGRMLLKSGQHVPAEQLPKPLRICVGQGKGATFALHAWDNDNPIETPSALDFDRDEDELLEGFQMRIGAELPVGEQTRESKRLSVRYQVTRGIAGDPMAAPCPPLAQPS